MIAKDQEFMIHVSVMRLGTDEQANSRSLYNYIQIQTSKKYVYIIIRWARVLSYHWLTQV